MTNTTYLNPVDINVGDKFTFTKLGRDHIKSLIKEFDNIDFKDQFEIIKVRSTSASGEDSDDNIECDEIVTGAEIIKHVKSGHIIDLSNGTHDEYWAVFTNLSSHLFDKE